MEQVSLSAALGLVLYCAAVQGQLSVYWNGNLVTGPLLIYHDEVLASSTVPQLSSLDDAGSRALFCRAAASGRVAWYQAHGAIVDTASTSIFYQIRTSAATSDAALLRISGNSVLAASHNGLWTCRLNGANTAAGSVPVGLYQRGGEYGRITTNEVSISSYLTDPPTFTLVGDTSGGPPTTYTWTRDGIEITDGGSFSISLSLNESSPARFRESVYVSTLTVTGRLPGVYRYAVTNRATSTIVTDSITIEVSVIWNGSSITGPVLVYHDELPVHIGPTFISDTNMPVGLSCRSTLSAAAWYLPNGTLVDTVNSSTTVIQQIRTLDDPSVSLLLRFRNGTQLTTDYNGLWTCQRYTEGSIPVGVYRRGGGLGSITTNKVSLSSYSFLTDPPTFSLVGDTSGGPPTTYTWTRDGVVITDGGSFNIPLSLNESSPARFRDSVYVSTLTVTGRLPGAYGYAVTNRATPTMVTGSFTVEGSSAVNNLTAEQTGLNTVLVTWTAPYRAPPRGYQVTVPSASISETVSGISHTVTISQPGVHTIQVLPLSQHYPSEAVSVEVTVRDSVVQELGALSLNCSVPAPPTTILTWLKMSEGEVTVLLHSTRISINTHHRAGDIMSVLTIDRAISSDSGEYVCVASDGSMSTGTAVVRKTVTITAHNNCVSDGEMQRCLNGGQCVDLVGSFTCLCAVGFVGDSCHVQAADSSHPTIQESPTSRDAELIRSVNLTCRAEGSPAPSYQWYKDGAPIPGETRAYLHIEETAPEDRGNYTCVAANSGGQVESEPARVVIFGIYQYAVTIPADGNNANELQNLLLIIASSTFLDKRFAIYSTRLLDTESGVLNVTVLVTIHEQPPLRNTSASVRQQSLLSHMNALPSIIVQRMERFDGCDGEMSWGMKWPEVDVGDYASSECPCAEFLDSLAGRAHRFCGGDYTNGAEWSEPIDTSMCAAVMSNITRLLCQAAMGAQNSTLKVSALVVNITSNPETLSAADVSAASFVVESLTEQAIADPQVRNEYLEIIDNIQQADSEVVYNSQVITNSSQKILDNLAKFSDMLELARSGNSSEDKEIFGFDTYALQLQDIDPSLFKGQTFTANLGSVEDTMKLQGDIRDSLVTSEKVMTMISQNSTASVELPEDFLDLIQGCTNDGGFFLNENPLLRLSYSVFLTDILFQSPQTQAGAGIGSIIVAVRLGCAENATSISSPIRMTFRTVKQLNNTEVHNGSCAVWDTKGDFGSWSTSGCREFRGEGDHTVCECKQLGHFGILFDLNPGAPMDPVVTLALFIITYIGISLSLLCLAALICTYLSSKKLRSDTHAQIILNMSLSLAGLYIFFLLGGHVTGIPVLCGFSAAFLHYFMLVFFAWTAVEATWLYLKLVKVYGTQSTENLYILKAGIPAWVIPFLIVTLCAGLGYEYYVSSYYCRATEWPFWLGFIAPFLVLYIFDWIMFIVIITSILKQRRASNKMRSQSSSKLHRENLIIALSLAVVFGLGWGFGLLSTSYPVEEITVTFQVLFSIFVGAQGALLFLLHGIRNSDARRVWKGWTGSLSSTTGLHSSSSRKGTVRTQHSATPQTSTLLHALPQPGNLDKEAKHAITETVADVKV